MTSLTDADAMATDRAEGGAKAKGVLGRSAAEQTNFAVGWNVVRTLGEGDIPSFFLLFRILQILRCAMWNIAFLRCLFAFCTF